MPVSSLGNVYLGCHTVKVVGWGQPCVSANEWEKVYLCRRGAYCQALPLGYFPNLALFKSGNSSSELRGVSRTHI